MRIIAGEAKGRKIAIPASSAIRPTSDRVRESIFNTLYSLGGVEAKLVIDVFAGSGALGLEALSRGASHVLFIERDQAALKTLKANIAALGFQRRAEVLQGDALDLLPWRSPVDVAFCDPPYAFRRWDDLLQKLNAALLVAESNTELELNSEWKIRKLKQYGTTFVSIAEKTMPSQSSNLNEPVKFAPDNLNEPVKFTPDNLNEPVKFAPDKQI